MPMSSTPIIISDVATGRRINRRDGFIGKQSRVAGCRCWTGHSRARHLALAPERDSACSWHFDQRLRLVHSGCLTLEGVVQPDCPAEVCPDRRLPQTHWVKLRSRSRLGCPASPELSHCELPQFCPASLRRRSCPEVHVAPPRREPRSRSFAFPIANEYSRIDSATSHCSCSRKWLLAFQFRWSGQFGCRS